MISEKLSALICSIINDFNTLQSKCRKSNECKMYLMCGIESSAIISSAVPFFYGTKQDLKCEYGTKIGILNGIIPIYKNINLQANKLVIGIENFNYKITREINFKDFCYGK